MGELSSALESQFSKSKICKYSDKDQANCKRSLLVEPDLGQNFRVSRSYNELFYYWWEWRKVAGDSGTKEKYLELIRLKNEMAVKQGFKNLADGLQYDYDTDNFGNVVMKVWREGHQISQGERISLEDLYKQLHACIRRRLIKIYNQQVRNA